MSQFTDYTLELMAKGWVSLNKDKPEHVQEVELAKLLKGIKSVCDTESEKIYDNTWYLKNAEMLYTGQGVSGVCELTGKHSTNLHRMRFKDETVDVVLLADLDSFVKKSNGFDLYKIKPDTVLQLVDEYNTIS